MRINMSSTNPRALARIKRKARIRKKITGTAQRPRLSVFRSARHVYAQIVDDTAGATLVAASSLDKAFKEQSKFENKVSAAQFVGQLVAERALEKGIKKVISTDISRDGMLAGPSFQLYGEIRQELPGIEIIASGGIASMSDILKLDEMGVPGVITGKAIYENRITLKEIEVFIR